MTHVSRRTVTFGLLASLSPIAGARAGHTDTRRGTAFGTIVSVTAGGRRAAQVEAALDAAFAAIRAVERSMSLFDNRSEISRFNGAGALSRPSPLFIDALDLSMRAFKATDGAFDPSVQPYWQAWSSAAADGRLPQRNHLAAARGRVGFDHVRWSRAQAASAKPGLELTLNGVAQGYAADLVAAVMRRYAIESAFIDTGETGAIGELPLQERMTGVRHPRLSGGMAGFLPVTRRFAATSGDYAAAFASDFSAHHIFDPLSGISPKELASVTVLAPSGAMADALATAFMVCGRDKSLALAKDLDGVDALLISKNGDLAMSEGMRKIFKPA